MRVKRKKVTQKIVMEERVLANVLLATGVILLDQAAKIFAPKLGFSIVQNPGIAFGLLPNFAWGIVIVFLLLFLCINELIHRNKDPSPFTLHFSLIIGGGLSNLFDRLYFGYIRDFIDLKIWPVFNLADVAITVGVVMLFAKQIKAKLDPKRDSSELGSSV